MNLTARKSCRALYKTGLKRGLKAFFATVGVGAAAALLGTNWATPGAAGTS
jgi:hypothetical protein